MTNNNISAKKLLLQNNLYCKKPDTVKLCKVYSVPDFIMAQKVKSLMKERKK